MRQTDQQADEAFREQCRRQMARPLALRIKYGFNRVYKPVLDDAPWRSFNSTAEYRAWCEANLPEELLVQARRMTEPREFRPLQAEEIARAFNNEGVDYLFIGKSGAILLGYPGTTQDVHIFPARSPENGSRIVAALRSIGFEIHATLEREIVAGKSFVQIKTGPFDVDLVFAPDGIISFEDAKARGLTEGIFRVANLRDIIASKRASGRKKDEVELPLLENFRVEFEKRHPAPLRSASEIVARKSRDAK